MRIDEDKLRIIWEATSINNQEQLEEWYPEVFKKTFEVGNYYYHSPFNIVIKITKINEDGSCEGYGLDGETFRTSENWCNVTDFEDFEEISKEAFLTHLKHYAKDVLGFKEGVSCYWKDGKITHYNLKGEISIPIMDDEYLDMSGDLIYEDGVFAEIISETKPEEIFKGSIWTKTMHLRWKDDILQQKQVSDEGDVMWVNI